MKTAIALVLVLSLTSCGHGFNYSNGERAGYVLKFSKRGFVCKTWEGTMNLAGLGQNSLVEFDFTVDNDKTETIKLLEEAVTNGRRVKVKYSQGKLVGSCTGDTSYFIQDVSYTDESQR